MQERGSYIYHRNLSGLKRAKRFPPFLGNSILVLKLIVFFVSLHGLTVKFNLLWILVGGIVGHLLYLMAVLQTQGSLGVVKRHFLSSPIIAGYYIKYPGVSCQYLVYAIFEEVVWRYFVQSYLLPLGVPLAITITAVLFTLDHFSSFTNANAKVVNYIEFFLFSSILGFFFYITYDFLLVIFVHLVRNCNIIFYRQLFGNKEEGVS